MSRGLAPVLCDPPGGSRPTLGPVSVEQAAASVDVGFRSERGPVLIGIMLSTALVAIDATVIATAVPSVVAELGGFAEFPWLFSVYLLAQAVTVPVYGKLADVFRPQAGDARRHRPVPRRLHPVRNGVEHGRADRVPRGAGPGRRR